MFALSEEWIMRFKTKQASSVFKYFLQNVLSISHPLDIEVYVP